MTKLSDDAKSENQFQISRRKLLGVFGGGSAALVLPNCATAGGYDSDVNGSGIEYANEILETRLTQRFGLTYPFVSAGMAFVALPELVAAVSNAGGLGILGAAPEPPAVLQARIQQIRALTSNPFGVDFIVASGPLGDFVTDEHIYICLAEQVPLVVFHFNLPDAQWVSSFNSAGIDVWFQTGSACEAEQAVAIGVRGIISQGRDAGGHNKSTKKGISAFLSIRHSVPSNTLVLMGGGIANAKRAAKALLLGADGVWVGTRMVATHEAFAHPDYKSRIVAASKRDTAFTTMFGPEFPGGRQRVLRNSIVNQFAGKEHTIPDPPPPAVIGSTVLFPGALNIPQDMPKFSALVPTPDTTGDFEQMDMPAGSKSVKSIHAIQPAGYVVTDMMEGARAILEGDDKLANDDEDDG